MVNFGANPPRGNTNEAASVRLGGDLTQEKADELVKETVSRVGNMLHEKWEEVKEFGDNVAEGIVEDANELCDGVIDTFADVTIPGHAEETADESNDVEYGY